MTRERQRMAGFPSSSSSTFWRQSSGAIPGRVNQTAKSASASGGGGGGGNSSALNTFQHFQESVSDAWDIDEPLTPTVMTAVAASATSSAAAASTTNLHGQSSKISEKKTAEGGGGGGSGGGSGGGGGAITPTHAHRVVQVGQPYPDQSWNSHHRFVPKSQIPFPILRRPADIRRTSGGYSADIRRLFVGHMASFRPIHPTGRQEFGITGFGKRWEFQLRAIPALHT